MRPVIALFILLIAMVLGCVIACGQEPLPVPVGGPITDKLEKMVERFRSEDKQEMEGLLDRLRTQDERLQEQYTGLLDRLRERDTSEAARHQGILGLLKEIRDREPGGTDSRLFPNIIGIRADLAEMRSTTGPIREAIGMLTSLVYGLIILAGVLLLVDVYRTFFRRA